LLAAGFGLVILLQQAIEWRASNEDMIYKSEDAASATDYPSAWLQSDSKICC
jgi:hypothetical protein